jgi:galactose oxidase
MRRPDLILVDTVAVACFLTSSAPCQGVWRGPYDTFIGGTPVRAAFGIHLIHVRPASPGMGNKGRFLYWGRSNNPGASVRPYVWDPDWSENPTTFGIVSQTSIETPLNYEAFCCGQTLLKDGSPIICGANFLNSEAQVVVSTYNIATNTWNTRDYDNDNPDSSTNHGMRQRRWYPTVTRMPEGEIVITGGMAAETGPNVWPEGAPFEFNTTPLDPNSYFTKPSDLTSQHWGVTNYPFTFPVSASQVVIAGSGSTNATPTGYSTFLFNALAMNPTRTIIGGVNSDHLWLGSAVMYLPGKILKMGGMWESNEDHGPATNRVESIDMSNLNAPGKWREEAPLNHARMDHNAVLLPDGTVGVFGGSLYHVKGDPGSQGQSIYANPYDFRVNVVEIGKRDEDGEWTWTDGASSAANLYRGYHSTAALMPDGRVVLMGSDIGFPLDLLALGGPYGHNPTAEIYSPPYCGASNRPEIVSGPDQLRINEPPVFHNLTLSAASTAVNKACLISLAAVTHGFDMNQRYVPLTMTGSGTARTVLPPSSSVAAPYGWYMLWVTRPDGNGNDIPCKLAKYVEVVPGDGQIGLQAGGIFRYPWLTGD